MMNSWRSDLEKTNLIEEGKKIGINKVIKLYEITNKTINVKMKSYCLKGRKDTENIYPNI